MSANYDAELIKSGGVYDIQIDANGDIQTADFFDTAILMSLWVERRADASEMPASHLRRGWIGNESTPGFENGSKLWLYSQSRVTRTVLNGIETVIINGLQWLIDDDIATNIKVSAALSSGKITISVIIERPNSPVEKRYYELWNNTGI